MIGEYEKQANDAPAAGNDRYNTNVDAPLNISAPGILPNDSDPEGELLSAVLESGPSIGSLDFNPDGSFDYLPETDYHGGVTFTYHATDGLLDSNIATMTIIVGKVRGEVYLLMTLKASGLGVGQSILPDRQIGGNH